MVIWQRVKDVISGHQYDVTLDRFQVLLERGAVEAVNDGPSGGRKAGGSPRRPKLQRPMATLAPQPTKRAAKPPAEAVETKESESV